ncbi:MAG: hypothetical protein R3F59_09610 [Myxococcota bacterium]
MLGDLAVVRCLRGDLGAALRSAEAGLQLMRDVGDRRLEGQELGTLGNSQHLAGHPDARATLQRAVERLDALGSRGLLARAVANLGSCELGRGDLVAARQLEERALALADEVGNRRQWGESRAVLGRVALVAGDRAAARAHYEAALAVAAEVDQPQLRGEALASLAELDADDGDLPRAAERIDAAEAQLRAISDALALGRVLCARVRVASALGDAARAETARAEVDRIVARAELRPGAPLLQLRAALPGR